MANATWTEHPPSPSQRTQPQPHTRRRFRLLRLISFILLSLIILTGLAVIVIWLTIHPKRIIYTIEDAYVTGYHQSKGHLNATFHISIASYNPNRRVSIYYDEMKVKVDYEDQTVAASVVPPFNQGHRNWTRIETAPVARDASLLKSVSRKLRITRTSGTVKLDVRIKARVMFKVGKWESSHRELKIECSPVLAHFLRGVNYERTYCHVDL